MGDVIQIRGFQESFVLDDDLDVVREGLCFFRIEPFYVAKSRAVISSKSTFW